MTSGHLNQDRKIVGSQMKRHRSGFTLMELVTVIVLIGILAATATAKFVDFRNDATQAAVKGIAAQLNAAMELNKNARLMNMTYAVTIDNCSQSGTLMSGGLPTAYTLSALALTAPFQTGICTVSAVEPGTISATFVGYGISS